MNSAKKHNITLIVALFPNLNRAKNKISGDRVILKAIEDFFAKKNILVLNVINIIDAHSNKTFTINSNDPHPNSLLHRLVAEELHKLLADNKIF